MKKRARAIKPDFEEQEEIDRDPVCTFRLCTITFDPISYNLVLYITRLLLSILIPIYKPRTMHVVCIVREMSSPFLRRSRRESYIAKNVHVRDIRINFSTRTRSTTARNIGSGKGKGGVERVPPLLP